MKLLDVTKYQSLILKSLGFSVVNSGYMNRGIAQISKEFLALFTFTGKIFGHIEVRAFEAGHISSTRYAKAAIRPGKATSCLGKLTEKVNKAVFFMPCSYSPKAFDKLEKIFNKISLLTGMFVGVVRLY